MNGQEQYWYAIRVTYAREAGVKTQLAAAGIDCYIPMHYAEREFINSSKRVLVPAIHNLLFVHADAETLHQIEEQSTLPIRHIMDRRTREPRIIPTKQMEDFMRVAGDGGVMEFAETAVPTSCAGAHVRITQGALQGVEGYYIRDNNGGRVAVVIQGIATVMSASLPAHFVQQID